MPPRQTLFTDPRMGEGLWPTIERLARGSGVVVRHDHLAPADRYLFARRIAQVAERRGLRLSVAGDAMLARQVGAEFVHRPQGLTHGLPFTLPVHHRAEALRARRLRPAFVYVSPVFSTRSHPGAPALGPARARTLAVLSGRPAIALGGMDAHALKRLGPQFVGWAGIDALLRD